MSFTVPHWVHVNQRGIGVPGHLIAAYPMCDNADGSLIDICGSWRDFGYSGTLAIDSSRFAPSEFGTGFKFTRANAALFLRTAENFGNTSQGTICAWVSHGACVNTEYYTLFCYGGGNVALPGALALQIFTVTGATKFRIYQMADGGTDDAVLASTSAYSLAGTGWHHWAIASNGTVWTVYLDGVDVPMTVTLGSNNGDWFSDTTIGTPRFYIGATRYDGGDAHWLDGTMADFRVYDVGLEQPSIALIAAGLG